jgi:hypothetical protein
MTKRRKRKPGGKLPAYLAAVPIASHAKLAVRLIPWVAVRRGRLIP